VTASWGHSDNDNVRVPGFGDGAPLGNTASFTHTHSLAAVNNLGYSSNRHYLIPWMIIGRDLLLGSASPSISLSAFGPYLQ
jgi:hypothetical protein